MKVMMHTGQMTGKKLKKKDFGRCHPSIQHVYSKSPRPLQNIIMNSESGQEEWSLQDLFIKIPNKE